MSILSVNGDSRGDCPVWRSEDGEFFSVGMGIEEKVPPKEVWGWGLRRKSDWRHPAPWH
ncbi:hypothetical protein A2U01_0026229 [Trifolium medium]|uniref:Uncharacterized protein n=1 Tax=Trifolium medium TaxID=97028 RepID=A0A392P177_9FABA|nr:hypothetical protein [Trifolium medium]